MNGCEVCEALPGNVPILETSRWVVSLNPDQGYLGRCYVTLRAHKGNMSELTDDDWREFSGVVRQLEGAVKGAFGAAMCNWVCLMNNAFQVEPATPHVHWHFRPRYSSPVVCDGEEFADPQFGHHYDRSQVKRVDEATLAAIREKIETHL